MHIVVKMPVILSYCWWMLWSVLTLYVWMTLVSHS